MQTISDNTTIELLLLKNFIFTPYDNFIAYRFLPFNHSHGMQRGMPHNAEIMS